MDLVAFKKTLRYARAAAPDEVVQDVGALRLFDASHEALERRWRRLMVFGFVGAFIAVFVGGILSSVVGAPWPMLAVPALLGLGIVSAIRKRAWGRLNLANERYELLAAVCRLLKADLPREGTIDAGLELDRPEQPRYLTRQLERGRWKCKLYVQPWLRLRGKLVDGTRFDVRAVERQEVRTCWKTNARGKQKHKRKVKATTLLDVVLVPRRKEGQAGLAGLGERLTQAAKLPPEARLLRVRADADGLSLRAALTPADPRTRFVALEKTVALMLLSVYQVVAASRRGVA
jgi:hypothetical protein